MKTAGATLIAAVLLFSGGCAQKADWIESTLVTVDVTGAWRGQISEATAGVMIGGSLPPDVTLQLEQEGPRVKGNFVLSGGPGFGRYSGPLEGRVGGDVLHFTVTGTSEMFRGELQPAAMRWRGHSEGQTLSTPGLSCVGSIPLRAPRPNAHDVSIFKLTHYQNQRAAGVGLDERGTSGRRARI